MIVVADLPENHWLLTLKVLECFHSHFKMSGVLIHQSH